MSTPWPWISKYKIHQNIILSKIYVCNGAVDFCTDLDISVRFIGVFLFRGAMSSCGGKCIEMFLVELCSLVNLFAWEVKRLDVALEGSLVNLFAWEVKRLDVALEEEWISKNLDVIALFLSFLYLACTYLYVLLFLHCMHALCNCLILHFGSLLLCWTFRIHIIDWVN